MCSDRGTYRTPATPMSVNIYWENLEPDILEAVERTAQKNGATVTATAPGFARTIDVRDWTPGRNVQVPVKTANGDLTDYFLWLACSANARTGTILLYIKVQCPGTNGEPCPADARGEAAPGGLQVVESKTGEKKMASQAGATKCPDCAEETSAKKSAAPGKAKVTKAARMSSAAEGGQSRDDEGEAL